MMSFLLLGFLLGIRHALEADHIATVASLVSHTQSKVEGKGAKWQALKQGLAWGVGHSLTLLVVGGVVIWMDTLIPENIAASMEAVVGILMVLLGLDVMFKCYRANFHFHVHQHDDGRIHMHGHSHKKEEISAEHHHGKSKHAQQTHQHHHPEPSKLPLRALLIGMVHGMAGSAALILLFVDSIENIWQGLFYILLFSLGSIVGMLLFSFAISIPLKITAKKANRLHYAIQMSVGVLTCAIGSSLISQWF